MIMHLKSIEQRRRLICFKCEHAADTQVAVKMNSENMHASVNDGHFCLMLCKFTLTLRSAQFGRLS